MSTLIMHQPGRGLSLHQENCGDCAAPHWAGWRGWRARQRQRRILRDLADDPHLLRDLGLNRQQALQEAGKPFWR
jgi:uncharacterized protein YjiS (DUF1127 family)